MTRSASSPSSLGARPSHRAATARGARRSARTACAHRRRSSRARREPPGRGTPLEHEVAQLAHSRTSERPLDDVARLLRVLDHVVDERVDPRRAARAEHRDRLARQLLLAQQTCAHRVVDVVVDVGRGRSRARSGPRACAARARGSSGARSLHGPALSGSNRRRCARGARRSAASARSDGSRAQSAVSGSCRAPPHRCARMADGRGRDPGRSPPPGPRSGAGRARPSARCSSPPACASSACGSDRRAAPRTPASCASGAETPCCERCDRGRVERACEASSHPPRCSRSDG